ncbi:hypothetical protein BXZ70DRAFT_360123 [Cristinia sonorae]|uniref:MYND-type domain-containing protein n=1 Tax=Cristinia sonorae TaxID=1940300 RepID=A0A8K0UIX6_9AGAR|nr:hypothetical protein BXZ70DRAFT_360123 [Cristinia sonorae]
MRCPWDLQGRRASFDSELVPPITKFGSLETGIPTSNDWPKVIHHEPECVPSWIYYFHKKHMAAELYPLIRAMQGALKRLQWDEYGKCHLPCVLVDIICDKGLFSDDASDFPLREELGVPNKGILYGAELAVLFAFSVVQIEAAAKLPAFQIECCMHVAGRITEFCVTLWTQRQYILTPRSNSPPGRIEGAKTVRSLLMTVIPMLVEVRATMDICTVRSTYAAHVLLLCWIHDNRPSRADYGILSCLEAILSPPDPKMKYETFTLQAVGSVSEQYAFDVATRFSSLLWDEHYPIGHIGSLTFVCGAIMGANTHVFSKVILPPSIGIVSGLVSCCQRYMCTASPTLVRSFVSQFIVDLAEILKANNIGDKKEFPAIMNFVAILSYSLLVSVQGNNRKLYDSNMTLMGIQMQMAGIMVLQNTEAGIKLYRNSARIWHDTLEDLRTVKPKGVTHATLQRDGILLWTRYGSMIGLKEGVDVQTLSGSSIPSDKPWFRIQKRCFYKRCVCAACCPPHHMRVCKGCWRVLYCSEKCQAL